MGDSGVALDQVSERPEPDLDQVREAMREHDERVEEDERAPARPPPDDEPEEPPDESP